MFIRSLRNINSLDNVERQTIKASRITLRNIDDNQEYTDSSNFDEQQKEQESEDLKLNLDKSRLDF
jgi:hypothetical protein